MSDRLPKNELEQLRDEVQLLTAEVDSLKAGPSPTTTKISLWRRLFGHLVYDGPETCGHCRYRKSESGLNLTFVNCKVLHENVRKDGAACQWFKARRRLMHRVRN